MPKSDKIWDMSDIIKNLFNFGNEFTQVKLKQDYFDPDRESSGVDKIDVRYKPTSEFFEFLKIEKFGKAYKYLTLRYKKLKIDEKKWQNDKSGDDNFPVQSVAYGYSLKIYTRAIYNKLAITNLNTGESRETFNELEELKNRFEADPRKKEELGFEVQAAAMKLLEKIVALKLVSNNDNIADFRGQFTTDERDYMSRRN